MPLVPERNVNQRSAREKTVFVTPDPVVCSLRKIGRPLALSQSGLVQETLPLGEVADCGVSSSGGWQNTRGEPAPLLWCLRVPQLREGAALRPAEVWLAASGGRAERGARPPPHPLPRAVSVGHPVEGLGVRAGIRRWLPSPVVGEGARSLFLPAAER